MAAGRERRGEGRPRRVFDNGELRLVLLHLVAQEPRHGYELIREVESLSRGVYAPSPGVVYPTLALLKDRGFVVESDLDPARKRYAVTAEGQAELAANAADLSTLLGRLTALAQLREQTDSAPVRRAMQNLKSALLDKLASADREMVLQVVALLDDAAQKIERL